MAASADGSTVAYTTFGPGAAYEAGVITGGRTRHWSVSAGAILGISDVSVSSDADMIAFITDGLAADGANEDKAWILPTGSAPGSLTAPTAYLINPATRTRTTLRLRGIPRAQYVTFAW